jgi:hypothetical protein
VSLVCGFCVERGKACADTASAALGDAWGGGGERERAKRQKP